MNKDEILNIISKHTLGVGKANTLEALADLENNTVDKLYALFSIHSVVVPDGTLFCISCKSANVKTHIEEYFECLDCGREFTK